LTKCSPPLCGFFLGFFGSSSRWPALVGVKTLISFFSFFFLFTSHSALYMPPCKVPSEKPFPPPRPDPLALSNSFLSPLPPFHFFEGLLNKGKASLDIPPFFYCWFYKFSLGCHSGALTSFYLMFFGVCRVPDLDVCGPVLSPSDFSGALRCF